MPNRSRTAATSSGEAGASDASTAGRTTWMRCRATPIPSSSPATCDDTVSTVRARWAAVTTMRR